MPPLRGRPPRLSRERIVSAALDLVDERGADALTMRALARELKADPMAVYRHVRDKDDLLGAMCDALIAALDPIDLAAPWRPQVRALALDLRARLLARPALLPILSSAPATPASVVIARDAVEVLHRGGIPVPLAVKGFATVFSFVLGHVQVEAALPAPGPDAQLRDGALAHLGAGAEPPHLDAALELMQDAGDFEFGLDLILDGIEQRAAAGRQRR